MANLKYYTFKKIKGDEQEQLLITLKSLIGSKKITDNLPNNTKNEIDNIKNQLNKFNENSTEDIILSGGTYSK